MNGPRDFHFRDGNFPERAGWKEVVATAGEGIRFTSSSVPGRDRSQQLANYPTDLLNSPPQVVEARISFSSAADVNAAFGAHGSARGESRLGKGERADGGRESEGNLPEFDSEVPGRRQKAAAAASVAAQRPGSKPGQSRGAGPDSPPVRPVSEPLGSRPATPNSRLGISQPGQVALEANKQGTPRNGFTELLAKRQFGFWFLLTAAFIAAGLGALHALEPGHGKTIVAAYLVGSRGTARHACLLGMIVTASHTAGVYVLGAITLYASHYVVPERLYPWLGAVSGLTIAGLGFYLFLRRYAAHRHSFELGPGHSHWPGQYHTHGIEGDHEHLHRHKHEHAHRLAHAHERADDDVSYVHAHGHLRAHVHHRHGSSLENSGPDSEIAGSELPASDSPLATAGAPSREKVSYRALLALGVTGGMVPCPAALVVLLSAVALRRVGFGLFLILAFSVGLAAVLIAVGLLMVYAGRFMSRLKGEGPLVTRWLPLASAAFITVLGLIITVRALVGAGVLQIHL